MDLAPFRLTRARLADVRDTLAERIREGLGRWDTEIKALPAYVRRPSRALSGDALVLDAGGTNLRAARVRLGPLGAEMRSGPACDAVFMPGTREVEARTASEFFARQAELIARVSSGDPLPLGYCFSYPARITRDGDAVLLAWTKGIRISGLVGNPVGRGLQRALAARGIPVRGVRVLNDTVAALQACARLASADGLRAIGLIAGTGTNMAGFFPLRDLRKLSPDERSGRDGDEEMAVNLESGNFSPPHLTPADEELDQVRSDNPGEQRFEKAVSGAYLPRLLGITAGRRACRDAGFDPEDPEAHAGMVAGLRAHAGPAGEAAGALLDRSADLAAAALAGLILAQGPANRGTAILAEGSLFWKTPGYARRVMDTLKTLVPDRQAVALLPRCAPVEATFIGSACAALSD
jgi:hexokinase